MNLEVSAQSLKTTRNKKFAIPLYFDVFGNLEAPPPIEIEWDLEGQKGQILKMGPVTLDEKSLSFGLRRLSDLDSKYQGPDREQGRSRFSPHRK